MNTKLNELSINGITYIPKEDKCTPKFQEPVLKQLANLSIEGYEYSIVRTLSAGVFAGYIKWQSGQEVTMIQARRIWYWEGAATLSELAMSGTSKPNKCKFPEVVSIIKLLEAIEIIPCTQIAKDSISSVPIWKA